MGKLFHQAEETEIDVARRRLHHHGGELRLVLWPDRTDKDCRAIGERDRLLELGRVGTDREPVGRCGRADDYSGIEGEYAFAVGDQRVDVEFGDLRNVDEEL